MKIKQAIREFSRALHVGINVFFWETAHLPLPKPNILPKARTKC